MRHATWILFALTACGEPGAAFMDDPEACSAFEEGCACEDEGAQIPCYEDPTYEEGELVCEIGRRSCRGGQWSACHDLQTHRGTHEEGEGDVGGRSSALLAPATACNPCNPNCRIQVDGPITDRDLNASNSNNVSYDARTGGITANYRPGSESSESYGTLANPFDLMRGNADRVELDPDGALVLGSINTNDDSIWIANTAEGTISRFDIRTHEETGRFWVGPFGTGNDPSRTSLNTAGDAFVTGRRGNFVSRISTLGEHCPDSNGDGVISTSDNGTALPWGEDDCVLWTADLSGVFPGAYVRAVAAQDVVDPITGDVREYVWVGGCSDQKLALLDGRDGTILMSTYVGVCTYGAAFDGAGNLWVSTINNHKLVRVDTNLCNADGCPWDGRCNESTPEGTACDDAVKQVIPTPNNNRPYGVTVDANQRVWLGGDKDVQRYDRRVVGGGRWVSAGIGTAGGWKAGIAADAAGNVWTTGSFGVIRLNGNDPTQWIQLAASTATQQARGWGVAVDADDKTWIIGRWENAAWVFEPGADLATNTVTRTAPTVRNPYTYSDMTGQQLRLAATPRGTYREVFSGCGARTDWGELTFDADTPPDTSVSFRVRTADTISALASATWIGLGVAPGVTSPIDVRSALIAAGIYPRNLAEVEVTLASSGVTDAGVSTPRVRSFSLTHQCATAEVGWYQHTYDATETCEIPPDRPAWGVLGYQSETPGSSSIEIQVQSANSLAALDAAPFATATVPALPDRGRINAGALLASSGFAPNDLFMRVRMRMVPGEGLSPVLYRMAMQWDCVPFE